MSSRAKSGQHPEYWDPLIGAEETPSPSATAARGKGDPPLPKLKKQSAEQLSLSEFAEAALSNQALLAADNDEELEEAKFWVPLTRPPNMKRSLFGYDGRTLPEVLVSVQMVPESYLEKLPAGHGRSEPNVNPTLPKPVGRLRFTFNCFSMIYQFIGPKFCRRILCVLFLLCLVLTIYYMIPVIFGNVVTAPVTNG